MLERLHLRSRLSFLTTQRVAWILLAVLILAYCLWMGEQVILRYTTFKATAFDLGNMDQAVWNTLHGHPFEFTNQGSNWFGQPIRLAQHVEPIIFLLALLYVFHADPQILLIFQTLALAAGALPTFLLTRKYIPIFPLLAPVMSMAYLASPALIGMNLYDFHPVALATPLFLYAMLALAHRRYVWFVLACFLAAMCKEEMPAVVGLLGLLVIWKYRLPRLGLALFICGMLCSAFFFLLVIPHFNVGAHQNNYWYRYQALGSTPANAALNVLLRPWILLAFFFTLDRVYYLFGIFRSSAFLALLAPEWLLPTIPSFAINLLASTSQQHSGVYQYNAAIIPFVIIAAIHGTRRLIYFWYGLRDESELRAPYREASVLGYSEYPPGKPVPGTAHIVQRVRSLLIRGRTLIVKAWHDMRVQAVITRLQPFLLIGRKRLSTFRLRLADSANGMSLRSLQKSIIGIIVFLLVLNVVLSIPLFNIFLANVEPGSREQHIQQILALIPPDASVSAGGNLDPHLSDRRYITVFPQLTVQAYGEKESHVVDYVIVDLDNVSPEDTNYSANFLTILNQIQRSKQFVPVAEAEGVLLLKRAGP